MSNLSRLALSTIASVILAGLAFVFPYTLMIYFFAPGFWLGDSLPNSLVNALGGYLFPVFASAVIWTLLIFSVWLLTRNGLMNIRERV
ncbi:MAG TPA: hypothetical protein VN256_02265 [Pyrinomonadaceae bacterium]|nr:hypothetical protein [Pyrinomonadaceae bacterium]